MSDPDGRREVQVAIGTSFVLVLVVCALFVVHEARGRDPVDVPSERLTAPRASLDEPGRMPLVQVVPAPIPPTTVMPDDRWKADEGDDVADVVARWASAAGWNATRLTRARHPVVAPLAVGGDVVTAVEALLGAQSGRGVRARVAADLGRRRFVVDDDDWEAGEAMPSTLATSPAADASTGRWVAAQGEDVSAVVARWASFAGWRTLDRSRHHHVVDRDWSVGGSLETALSDLSHAQAATDAPVMVVADPDHHSVLVED